MYDNFVDLCSRQGHQQVKVAWHINTRSSLYHCSNSLELDRVNGRAGSMLWLLRQPKEVIAREGSLQGCTRLPIAVLHAGVLVFFT